jgi:thiamine pyrophosphate-dependent acetolactate synthase large subunit-like protein
VKKMTVKWNKDADAALAEAKETRRPVLIDFSAAPA